MGVTMTKRVGRNLKKFAFLNVDMFKFAILAALL